MIAKLIYKVRSVVNVVELKWLHKLAGKHGFAVKRNEPISFSERVIENYFNTNFEKKALLSYLISPFINPVQNHHSNEQECYKIAEILNELEFNVDIIQWDNISLVPQKKYDLVIDNHNNLERLSPYLDKSCLKIFHATNTHWLYQNWIEHGRYHAFFLRTGVAITPPRLTVPGNSVEYADYITMFGNEFTKHTYGNYQNIVYHLPMSVTTVPSINITKDIGQAKRKFLWLNSHGALLKGVDIAIDAFKLHPELELLICGNIDCDNRFFKALDADLVKAPNIKLMGWVDTSSIAFDKIANECAWVLNTSFSEGGGGSTLNCMAKGLIPVISRPSSIDLPAETGFYIEENNAMALSVLLSEVTVLEDATLQKMSARAHDFIADNHTLENFKKKYNTFLAEILPGKVSAINN